MAKTPVTPLPAEHSGFEQRRPQILKTDTGEDGKQWLMPFLITE
jgi:hypothetical protein